MKNLKFLTILLLLLMIPAVLVIAEKSSKCADLVKECFSYGENQREQCFASTAKHTLCKDTDLGKVVDMRWQLSPVLPSDDIDAPGFMGPQLVDRQCLNNFDNQLSSALVTGEISELSLRNLKEALEHCKIRPTNELLKP